MRHLILLNDAKKDLALIKVYTSKLWDNQQSLKYMKELRQAIELINSNPNIGTVNEEIKFNLFSFPLKNHVVYYQFNEETLYLMAVMHKYRLPKNYLKDFNS